MEAGKWGHHPNIQVDRFDSDALLTVGGVRIIHDPVGKDFRLAEGVGKSYARLGGTCEGGKVKTQKQKCEKKRTKQYKHHSLQVLKRE